MKLQKKKYISNNFYDKLFHKKSKIKLLLSSSTNSSSLKFQSFKIHPSAFPSKIPSHQIINKNKNKNHQLIIKKIPSNNYQTQNKK